MVGSSGTSGSSSSSFNQKGREFILRGRQIYDAKTNQLEGWIREDVGGGDSGVVTDKQGMTSDELGKQSGSGYKPLPGEREHNTSR